MSFVLYRKTIHCPNCDYEGKIRIKGAGWGLPMTGVSLLIIGFWLWPLLIVGLLLLLLAMFRLTAWIGRQKRLNGKA